MIEPASDELRRVHVCSAMYKPETTRESECKYSKTFTQTYPEPEEIPNERHRGQKTFWIGDIAKHKDRKEEDKMLSKRRNPSLSVCRRYCRLGEELPCVVCKSISDMGLIFLIHITYHL